MGRLVHLFLHPGGSRAPLPLPGRDRALDGEDRLHLRGQIRRKEAGENPRIVVIRQVPQLDPSFLSRLHASPRKGVRLAEGDPCLTSHSAMSVAKAKPVGASPSIRR